MEDNKANKRPSGAEYKKRRKERDEKERKLPKIDTFFNKPPRNESETLGLVESVEVEQQESSWEAEIQGRQEPVDIQTQTTETTSGLTKNDDIAPIPVSFATDDSQSQQAAQSEHAECADSEGSTCSSLGIETESRIFGPCIDEKYPTDRGHYPVQLLDTNLKIFIIEHGSCRPKGPFPKDKKGRSFSEYYYEIITKAGIKILRTWLCYSSKLDMVYCEPCWLFADRSSKNYRNNWSEGINDWKGLSSKIKLHEESEVHSTACLIFDQWRLHGRIDEDTENQLKKETNFWRKVIERIVNVTLTLATCNLSFRGHREKIGEVNSGNFLGIIELLSQYDPVLKQLLEMPNGKTKYLSPKIQNEIIDLLSKRLERDMLDEIKTAPFYSIIRDTTQDIAKKDQMSEVFRYVNVISDENGRPVEVRVNETFLGFREITEQSAADLEKEILDSLDEKKLLLSKCRGQGYDGAAVMSGAYSGVQSRILSKEPTALFVHCAAHNFNLVINDAAMGVLEMKIFFDNIQNIYTFFGASILRWSLLSNIHQQLKKINPSNELSLKKLCVTRWSSRLDSVMAVRFRYCDIIKALTEIILRSKKKDEKAEAAGLKKCMLSFDFVVKLVIWYDVLKSVNFVSKLLQQKNIDLSKAASLLKDVKDELTRYRNNFQQVLNEAESLAKQWNVPAKFEERRVRIVKRHYDELALDERLLDAEKRFKCEVFYPTLDTLISQSSDRFNSLNSIVERFNVLIPSILATIPNEELVTGAISLSNMYENDLSESLATELISFRAAMRKNVLKVESVSDLAHMLIVENSAISSSYPNICAALMLFLTLPVTVATAERSFSKLKIIKNYLRSTMLQKRLSGLAVLSIECRRAKKMNVEDIIDEFASLKARKKMFT